MGDILFFGKRRFLYTRTNGLSIDPWFMVPFGIGVIIETRKSRPHLFIYQKHGCGLFERIIYNVKKR
jgi:hypothetical protein